MLHTKMNTWRSAQTFFYILLKLFDICKRRVICIFFCYFIEVLLTTLRLSPLETTWPLNSVFVPDESPIKPGVDLERITESLNDLISMNVFLILREQAGAVEEHKNWFAIAKERTWRLRAKLFLMYKFWTHHVFYFHQCTEHCSSRIISSTGILFISTSLIMECALPTMIGVGLSALDEFYLYQHRWSWNVVSCICTD